MGKPDLAQGSDGQNSIQPLAWGRGCGACGGRNGFSQVRDFQPGHKWRKPERILRPYI